MFWVVKLWLRCLQRSLLNCRIWQSGCYPSKHFEHTAVVPHHTSSCRNWCSMDNSIFHSFRWSKYWHCSPKCWIDLHIYCWVMSLFVFDHQNLPLDTEAWNGLQSNLEGTCNLPYLVLQVVQRSGLPSSCPYKARSRFNLQSLEYLTKNGDTRLR